jgi:hypothetical protein
VKAILALGMLPLAAIAALHLSPAIPERLKQLPPTPIDYDRSLLDDRETRVLAELIEASRPIGEIFLRQVSEKNLARRTRLPAPPTRSPTFASTPDRGTASRAMRRSSGRSRSLPAPPFIPRA